MNNPEIHTGHLSFDATNPYAVHAYTCILKILFSFEDDDPQVPELVHLQEEKNRDLLGVTLAKTITNQAVKDEADIRSPHLNLY